MVNTDRKYVDAKQIPSTGLRCLRSLLALISSRGIFQRMPAPPLRLGREYAELGVDSNL